MREQHENPDAPLKANPKLIQYQVVQCVIRKHYLVTGQFLISIITPEQQYYLEKSTAK